MSSAPSSSSSSAAPVAGSFLSIAVLAVAAFVIVTTEFLLVGLLPALSRDLGVSVPVAGQLVTLFAVVVMWAGPLMTATLAHRERRQLFVSVLWLFAGANALAAIAPNMRVLALARVLPALALPLFWGTASETAAQLAGPARAGRAVSLVYLGISGAMLLGIPLGTLAGNLLGWRGAFGLLAALSAAVAVLMRLALPVLQPGPKVPLRQQAGILRDRHFLGQILLSILVFTAMFSGYTYLSELLETRAGVPASHVGWWLMGFGAIGLLGNWLGGLWVDRRPLATTAVFSLLLAAGMCATSAAATHIPALIPALALWGIANTALYPICQIRVMKAAPQAQALAGTLNVSAANGGIALGALLGGVSLSHWGVASVAWTGAGLAGVAMVGAVMMAAGRNGKRPRS